tara:strand:- start:41 stop:1456 length:1416 start_codon:yes stop_codon:yes gene_type:complete
MAKASTQKKTSLEPSEVFCAVGLLMPSDDMRDLVTDQTGVKLLKWASSDGDQISKKITPLDNRFKAMFKTAGTLKRSDKKRSDMVANIVAGFSGALGSKAFMKAMNTKVDVATAVYMTGATWPSNVDIFRMKDQSSGFDYNSSDLVVQAGPKKFFGISLKKKPTAKSPDPTIINKAFSTFLDGDDKNKKALQDLNKVRQQYFADIVKKAQKDGIINVRGLESMSTEEVWNKKLKKPNGKDTVALINLKGFNEKDDPIELTDVPGTVDQGTIYDKPTGRMGLKDYINADLSKKDNELFKGFNEIVQKNAEYFANSLIDMVLKVQLDTKLSAKNIGDYNFEFALVTGFADYKQNSKDENKDKLNLEKAKFIPLHTILCGLANLAGNKKPYKMELDTAKKEKANAAKVFYQLSRDGVPILDLELRYKGDFKSMPQFFATITDEFQTQLNEKCLVTKPDKKPNETAILNKTLYAK